MRDIFIRGLIVMVSVLCILACRKVGPTDAGSDADTGGNTDCDPADDCCNADGTACAHGCDGTDCYSDCAPQDNCCTETGTWRTDCSYGCNVNSGSCWLECNPSDSCCDADGTFKTEQVQQPGTDLYWQSCPLGQTWTAGVSCGCTDSPGIMLMYWCDASGVDAPNTSGGYWCQSDHDGTDKCAQTYPATAWRLPTAEEYSLLLEETGLGNYDGKACDGDDGDTVCTAMFGYNSGRYWSSSSYDGGQAWNAYFDSGDVNNHYKGSLAQVRCVRTEP